MQFLTTILAAAAVTGAVASYEYAEEPVYTTVDDKVYTSVKTCSDKYAEPTTAPVYESEAPVPTYPASEVTYTSYEKITVTSCGDYVTDCPALTYTSEVYSTSTCGGAYYTAPANVSSEYPYETPAAYPTETEVPYPSEVPYESETLTHTYYTTVCPGKDYCYATTVTSTYCPGKPTETAYVPEHPTYVPTYPAETTTCTTDVPVATYTPVAPCNGYDCPAPAPVKNETTPYVPPAYEGSASSFGISFGALALAAFAMLISA